MSEVCVDASFALKLVLPEPHSESVRAAWATWVRDEAMIVAPWLWLFEVHAVLRRRVVRGELTDAEAVDAWRLIRRQGIRSVHPRGLLERAWELAVDLGRPTTYDTVYLASAELRGCELWTADVRLINAAGGRFPWIRTPQAAGGGNVL